MYSDQFVFKEGQVDGIIISIVVFLPGIITDDQGITVVGEWIYQVKVIKHIIQITHLIHVIGCSICKFFKTDQQQGVGVLFFTNGYGDGVGCVHNTAQEKEFAVKTAGKFDGIIVKTSALNGQRTCGNLVLG